MSRSLCGDARCKDGFRRVVSVLDPDDTVMDICPHCDAIERKKKTPPLTFATLQQSMSDQNIKHGARQMRDKCAELLAAELARHDTSTPTAVVLDNLWATVEQIRGTEL